jgi:hypothetical protein
MSDKHNFFCESLGGTKFPLLLLLRSINSNCFRRLDRHQQQQQQQQQLLFI